MVNSQGQVIDAAGNVIDAAPVDRRSYEPRATTGTSLVRVLPLTNLPDSTKALKVL
jgi:hypothetical protein